MKRLLICLIALIYSSNVFAASKSSINYTIDTSAVIRKIQSDFLSINKKLKLYKKKTKDAFGMSAEGGKVTGYYSKGLLKKIHCIFYGETGKVESDYYFNENGLFFLYKKEVFYDKPIYLKDFKTKNIVEIRYYLFDNQIIRKLTKSNTSSVLSFKEIKAELKPIMGVLNEK